MGPSGHGRRPWELSYRTGRSLSPLAIGQVIIGVWEYNFVINGNKYENVQTQDRIMAIKRKLQTQDRIMAWNNNNDMKCSLCSMVKDSHNHLTMLRVIIENVKLQLSCLKVKSPVMLIKLLQNGMGCLVDYVLPVFYAVLKAKLRQLALGRICEFIMGHSGLLSRKCTIRKVSLTVKEHRRLAASRSFGGSRVGGFNLHRSMLRLLFRVIDLYKLYTAYPLPSDMAYPVLCPIQRMAYPLLLDTAYRSSGTKAEIFDFCANFFLPFFRTNPTDCLSLVSGVLEIKEGGKNSGKIVECLVRSWNKMVTTRRNSDDDVPNFEAMITAVVANALPNLTAGVENSITNDIRK
ncbi:hypothetical protein Tco_1464803 [Tanacetum coccineum]